MESTSFPHDLIKCANLIDNPMAYDDENDDSRKKLLQNESDSPNLIGKNVLKRRYCNSCNNAPPDRLKSPDKTASPFLTNFVSNFENGPPKFKRVFIFLAVYLSLGTLCFYLVRHQIKGTKTNGIVDALYFCAVTMTTVGYGDIVPDSVLSKLLACVFVFSGMALVGLILSKAADYIVEKQEVLLVKAIHINEKFGPSDIVREVETNRVKYKFITASALLLLLIIVGIAFLTLVEEMEFVDAIYCVCVTITTLGYGDESFSTRIGRIFAVFWILSSTMCLAQFFLYLAEFYTEKRQKSFVRWVLARRLTVSDLEAADLDHDKVVAPAEFILFKLKEMGKISQEDISTLMERFNNLDVDQSGTLSASDVMQSESS